MEQKRNLNTLTGIRIIWALLIVVCHWASVCQVEAVNQMPFIHGGYSVTAFMVSSGFLTQRKYGEEFSKFKATDTIIYVKKNAKKLYLLHVITMIPFLICNIFILINSFSTIELIKLCVKIVLNLTLTQCVLPNGQYISLNGVSWYFSCLLLIYCIAPSISKILRKFSKKNHILIFIASLAIIFLLDKIPQLYAHPIFRGWQFMAGMLVYEFVKDLNPKKHAYLFTSVSIIMSILSYFCIVNDAITLMDTVSVSIFVGVFSIYDNTVYSKFMSSKLMMYGGKVSSSIFLIHFPVFVLSIRAIIKYYGSFSSILTVVLLGLCLLFFTIILSIFYDMINQKVKTVKYVDKNF